MMISTNLLLHTKFTDFFSPSISTCLGISHDAESLYTRKSKWGFQKGNLSVFFLHGNHPSSYLIIHSQNAIIQCLLNFPKYFMFLCLSLLHPKVHVYYWWQKKEKERTFRKTSNTVHSTSQSFSFSLFINIYETKKTDLKQKRFKIKNKVLSMGSLQKN